MKLRFWYSVYGATADAPSPLAMSDSLRRRTDGLAHEFEPDNEQWRSGHFLLPGSTGPAVLVQRKRIGDDGFFEELEQAEECLTDVLHEPHGDLVMSQICRAQQVIHLVPCPGMGLDPTTLATICEQLCGIIARTSGGLIQVHQEGFFNAQGESLLPYRPQHKLQTT